MIGKASAALFLIAKSTRSLIAVASGLISATKARPIVVRRERGGRIDDGARADDENDVGARGRCCGVLATSPAAAARRTRRYRAESVRRTRARSRRAARPSSPSARRASQRVQRASRRLPCSSSTLREPARRCSESTFCVASVKSPKRVLELRERVVARIRLRTADGRSCARCTTSRPAPDRAQSLPARRALRRDACARGRRRRETSAVRSRPRCPNRSARRPRRRVQRRDSSRAQRHASTALSVTTTVTAMI